jgi:hypothetical protein
VGIIPPQVSVPAKSSAHKVSVPAKSSAHKVSVPAKSAAHKVSVPATWYIRYIYYWILNFQINAIFIKNMVRLSHVLISNISKY